MSEKAARLTPVARARLPSPLLPRKTVRGFPRSHGPAKETINDNR
jgi:hypothetical protein